jgi:glucans biosynthesis protein C
MNPTERSYYLDWVRIVVILLLVPFHSAITFTVSGDWNIKYPQDVPPLELLIWFLSRWIMPVLFLVSGMSAYYSLEKRSVKEFTRDRYTKLLVPFFAGFLLLCPIASYLRALFLGTFHGNYLSFYPHFFGKPYPEGNFTWGHFWFLIYLYVFTLILRPLFVRMNRVAMKERVLSATSILEMGPLVYLLALPLMVSETILRPSFPGHQNLVWDWANFILYLILVFYGFVLATNKRILDNIMRIRLTSLILGLVCFAAAVAWVRSGAWRFLGPAYHTWDTLVVFTLMFAALGYAKALFNTRSRVHNYLNNASFTVYAFHFLPITVLGYYIATDSMNVYLKYLVIVLCSYPATFAAYEIVRRIPGIRFLFAIKAWGRGHPY